jgi:cell division protein FtsZ
MIEFTQDGPFADKVDHLFPDRVRILGLGQTGAAVCDQIVLRGRPAQDLWVFDTDQLTIEGSIVPNRHLLGGKLVHGLGCNGDLELAREIVVQEETRLEQVSRGCDFLVLVLGLAGATGVALAERLIELTKEAGAKVIVVGVQPFGFEGWTRREKSIQAIASLRQQADSVLILSHDRLRENEATVKNIRHGFHLMHGLIAKTAQALGQIVCKRGLIQLSFADVRSLYGRYAGSEVLENCWVAHVEGDMRDCAEDLVAELLEGPLLADEAIWKQIDHAIVAVSGTRHLGLSDVQEMVSVLKDRLPANIPIATSASLDEENHTKVRMSVLFATTAPVKVSAPEMQPTPSKKSRPISSTGPLPTKIELETPVSEPEPVTEPIKPFRPSKSKPAPVVMEEAPVLEETEVLALAGEPVEPPATKGSARTKKRFVAKQEEMQFEAATRGRFEKTHETMYRGENLDQPTFRRRGLKIKL